MSRALRSLAAAFILLSLVACSDDDTTAPEPTDTTVASKTIPPTGGSLSIQDANGAQCTVTLPHGAVLKPTTVTLRTLTPPSGVRARFAIEPAGLDLLRPATFTVKIPDAAPLDGSFGLAFVSGEHVAVPSEVDLGNRTVTATLYQLGFNLPTPATAFMAASASPAEGEFIDVDEFECQLIRDSMTDAILRAQAFSGAFPPDIASPLIQQYKAMLLICENADSLAGINAAIQEIACNNASSAETQASVVTIHNVADFKKSLGELLAAEGLVQTVGSDCHVQSNTIESVFDKFITNYVQRIENPNFVRNFATWDDLWKELVPCTELVAIADAFEIAPARTRIEQELLPALFTRLRDVAAAACEEDENNALLGDILSGGHLLNHPIVPVLEMPAFTGFSQEELLEQSHRCGSTLTVDARAAQGAVLNTLEIDSETEAGNITVVNNGIVHIEDGILPLMCGQVLARDVVKVHAELPNTLPVVQLGSLNTSLNVNVATTLDGLPVDEPQPFDIVFTRDRAQCGISNGGSPTIELFRVHVNVLGALGAGAGEWQGGCSSGPVNGTFTIEIDNEGHVTGGYGGSASGSIQGTVNASGNFDASASGTAGECTWSGTVSGFGSSLTGSGSWTCGAGCSGSWTLGANPN